jgi:hypothetical protein
MAEFVLLYEGGSMPESEKEQAKVMKAWEAWFATIGSDLKDGGKPFASAKTVSSDGSVRDGHGGSHFSGYTIVTADSLAAAADIAKGSPVLEGGGSVRVYETIDM